MGNTTAFFPGLEYLLIKMGPDTSDEDDAKKVAFLRARIVEAAREGDTPEIKYLVGVSAAKRLLTAFDEVRPY